MSVIRSAGRSVFVRGREAGLAPRAGRVRWLHRMIACVLFVTATAVAYRGGLLLFAPGAMTVPVKRADLIISLSGYGVVESRDNLDITCDAPDSLGILEVVADGEIVHRDDLLLRLDSTPVEQAIAVQRRALTKAEAAAVQAKKDLQAAKLAIDAYREGTFEQERLRYDHEILLARKSLTAAEHSLLQSELAHRRGFGSRRHVEAREFVVETARSKLTAASHQKEVLQEFTGPRTLEVLDSKRVAAAARLKAEEVIVNREQVRLERLLDDLSRCLLRAPRDGMAIYVGGTMDGQDSRKGPAPHVYPGARVRRHQTLLRLADLAQLQIKMLVPEKKLIGLRRGQRVHVKVLDQEWHGEIVSIADEPQTASIADLDFQQYAVGIAVTEMGGQWKPGMTAELEVLIEQKKNVLTVPVLCVAKHAGLPHLRIKTRIGTVLREVTLGMTNDVLVEVVNGVSEGDLVLLNPVIRVE